MKLALLTPVIGGGNSGDAMIESAIRRLVPANAFRRFPIRRPLTAAEMADLNACDAAVICGTNLYQTRRQCALDLPFVEALKIPLIPLGVGTSAAKGEVPKMTEEDGDLIRALHSRAAVSSVRDPATQRFVESLGVKSARLTGCPVLFHGLVQPKIQMGEGQVTVSLRQTFLHGAEKWERSQEPLLEALCREHHPLLVCQGAYDLPQARKLARRFGLDWVHDDEWLADIHEWLAPRQAWTGGFRLHHGMLSLAHGRPAWFVGHDSRVDEFCRMMGLPNVDIRQAKPDDVLSWGAGRMADFEGFGQRWLELATEMEQVLKANGLPCALGEPLPKKPKLLFLVPRRDWAYDFSARSIQERLETKADVRVRYATDQPALRPEPYDLAVVFFWGENAHRWRGFDPNRVIKYVSSHRWQFPSQYGPLTVGGFQERYLSDAATVFVTSKRLFELLDGTVPRLRHVPNGFEPKVFRRNRERSGTLKVGAAGRREDVVKGFQDLLMPSVDGYEFTLAGGNLRHEEMNAFYNQLDVLVVTSSHEGEPLTLIEAMAAGCFPVCTDVGIVRELITDGVDGLILEERSAEAFQSALSWCQTHLDQVREAGRRNAIRLLEMRSWDMLFQNAETQIKETWVYATEPRFYLETADRGNCEGQGRRRVRSLLERYRQSVAADGGEDGNGLDLDQCVCEAWQKGQGWRMRSGVRYRIVLDGEAPRKLGWEGLECALREALLPSEPRWPWLPRRLWEWNMGWRRKSRKVD